MITRLTSSECPCRDVTLIDNPTSDLDPISQAEEAVKNTLDELQNIGVLQQSNQMDIEQLLNPVEEQNYMVASDQDICDAILSTMGNKGSNDYANLEDVEDEPLVPVQLVVQPLRLFQPFKGTFKISMLLMLTVTFGRVCTCLVFDSALTCPLVSLSQVLRPPQT